MAFLLNNPLGSFKRTFYHPYLSYILSSQTSRGSSCRPRYYLTMKTMQLNPVGFIPFHFHQDGVGRPSHTQCSRASLAVRFSSISADRWTLIIAGAVLPAPEHFSQPTHVERIIMWLQRMYRVDIWCLSSDLLISQKRTTSSPTKHRLG